MNNKGLIITASSLLVVIIGLAMYIALWADDVAYKKAVEKNSIRSYREFLKQYPNSEFAADIQLRYDECGYRRARESNRESELLDYIKDHPHSLYADSAKILVEVFAYNRALQTTDPSECRAYVLKYPDTQKAKTIQKRIDEMERQFYNKNIDVSMDKLSRYNINEYYRLFPEGKNKNKVDAKSMDLLDYEAYKSAKNSDTRYAWDQYVKNYPNGKYVSQAKARIREYEEIDNYKDYSLSNGSQPYASIYGYNSSCDYWGCSNIIVNAPYNSDVVALIKNRNGNVVRHAYIRAGRSYSFEVPNGTYQPYFYYGKGWYPKKRMPKGLRGGFLSSETHYYVHASYLENQEWTITLQLRTGGNLSTHSCSESDMF